jgi:hypothetical protein
MLVSQGAIMSKRTLDIPEVSQGDSAWAALLEETKQEIIATPELTEQEKRRLDHIDALPESEGEPGLCSGRPISETIIEDRGER